MSSRNLLIGGVIIGCVVVCLCVAALAGGAGAWAYYRAAQASATPPPPVSVGEGMDAIEQWVSAQRGWQPKQTVEQKFLTVEEVKQRQMDEFNKDTTPEEWADDVRVLAAFGLVEPDIDLYNLILRLYSEGVSGFYDPDTKELVLVSETGGLNAYERTVFAHEYNHALQDQNYDLQNGMGFSTEGWETDPQRASAAQALIEGDSSLLEEQYKDTYTSAENREYNRIIKDFDVSIYSEIPEWLLRDFAFPYVQGLDFVRRYYEAGGWARVDEVWKNPPLSTEQILHPARYESGDNPIKVARPALTDTLGAGWRQIDSSVNGEWYTFLMLAYGVDDNARVSEGTAKKAAEGWGGDGYVVYFNATDDALVLAQHWMWDTPKDADEFAAAFKTYGDQRFGAADTSGNRTCWQSGQQCFFTSGQQALWIAAPDAATRDAVLSQYPEVR